MSIRTKWLLWLGCLFSFAVQALLIASTAFEHRLRTSELKQLKRELEQIEETYSSLQSEIHYLKSPFLLEQKANELGLKPANQQQLNSNDN